MNFLAPLIPHALRNQIVAQLQLLATEHANSRLGDAISELSVFVRNHASQTPAKIAFVYAFSSFEQEIVNLITKVYLAILELR